MEQLPIKKFMQKTDFLVNLTKDPVFWLKIRIVIWALNTYFIQELQGTLLDLYEEPDGKIVLVTKCRHCGVVNKYIDISGKAFSATVLQLGCRYCGHRNLFYTVDTKKLPNYDKMEYLFRMLSQAQNEQDFSHAVDILCTMYRLKNQSIIF